MDSIKLIATDMDHTLLTEAGELPPNFRDYVRELFDLKVDFAIASGRPLYTLSSTFADLKDKMTFISDNGGVISHKGQIIAKSLLKPRDYQSMIRFAEQETDGIAIVCALDSAILSEKNKKYDKFLRVFYSKISYVTDLSKVNSEADKFTIYFPNENSKEYYDQIFKPKYSQNFSVTVGDTIWIDIMNRGINKGKAMRILGKKLEISTDQMMAFGDTYNDAEMLKAVKYSYLVKNASEDMKQYANFMTESNDDFGVTKILDLVIQSKVNENDSCQLPPD
ncbi:MAG: HAD family hydrolase [Sporolactobacillus sp.]